MTKIKLPTTFSASIDYTTGKRVSDLITKYDVRVLYKGKNRNNSYFSEDVIERMSETIGGIPIVGQYSKEEQDFLSHGELEFSMGEDGSIDFKNVGPVPYGFVPPEAETWYEDHLDKDGETRTYLTTEAYLWTGRYPELETLKLGLNNQSMELNPATMVGESVDFDGKQVQFVKSAEFHGLCILGKGVEPCFEGAAFAPTGVANYSANPYLSEVLSSMKKELKEANFSLRDEEEKEMEKDKNKDVAETVVTDATVLEPIEETSPEEEVEPTDEELRAIEEESAELETEVAEAVETTDEDIDELSEVNQDLADYEALQAEVARLEGIVAEYEAKELKLEKTNILNDMAKEITEDDRAAIFAKLDELSVDEVRNATIAAAYQNMKSIIEQNSLNKDVAEAIESDPSAAALTYSFTETVEVAERNANEPGFMKAVRERQKGNK